MRTSSRMGMRTRTAVVGSLLSFLALTRLSTGATASPKMDAVDIFPERLVFEASVLRATPSPWKEGPRFTRTRTIEVEFRLDRVLKGAARPTEGRPLSATITETSTTMGRIEGGASAWGQADIGIGDDFLVFGDDQDPAAAFSQPTSVYRKQADSALVQDVEWIAEEETRDPAAQATRLLALLGKSPRNHTLFMGRYVAAVAHRAAGASRAALLDKIAHLDSIPLDESGRAEALRWLHVGLLMQDTPPADEIHALLGASLRTLAWPPASDAGDVPARLESVVQVYLPWLARHVPAFRSAAVAALPRDGREKATAKARALAAMERFRPEVRDLLRQLAGALSTP